MVKVLIYSSKEIYDNASYEGRAEADIVAYRRDDAFYEIVKNRTMHWVGSSSTPGMLKSMIRRAERDEFDQELRNIKLCEEYRTRPYMELSKNAEVAQR